MSLIKTVTGLKDAGTCLTLGGSSLDYFLLVDEELILLCLKHNLLTTTKISKFLTLYYLVYSTILEYLKITNEVNLLV